MVNVLKLSKNLKSFILFPFIILLVSCSDSATSSTNTPPQSLAERYAAAVEDAKNADASKVCNTLTAIVDEGDSIASNGLCWKTINGERYVLALTWTSYASSYQPKIGMIDTARWGDMWITAVPELRHFFETNKFTADSTVRLRTAQLLGLPYTTTNDWMVQLWVKPADLFRPSPDPEIDDHTALLDFRSGFADSTYIKWFNNLKSVQYTGSKPYPWTRLGYTYDWGSANSHVGLSEFVLRKGSVYQVESVAKTLDYCD